MCLSLRRPGMDRGGGCSPPLYTEAEKIGCICFLACLITLFSVHGPCFLPLPLERLPCFSRGIQEMHGLNHRLEE